MVGLPVDEWIPVAGPIRRFADGISAREFLTDRARPVYGVCCCRLWRKSGRHRGVVRKEVSRSPARCQIVVREKLGISDCNRDPTDAEVRCQLARGGQLFSALKTPGQNTLRYHLLNLRLQRSLSIRVQKKGFDRQGHFGSLCWTYAKFNLDLPKCEPLPILPVCTIGYELFFAY